MFAMSLCKSYGFSGSITKEIKFRTSGFSASDRLYVDDVGAVQWENTLDTLVVDYPSDSERFINAATLSADHGAYKYLNPLFVAFSDLTVDLDDIAYLEVRNIFFQTFVFNRIKYCSFH